MIPMPILVDPISDVSRLTISRLRGGGYLISASDIRQNMIDDPIAAFGRLEDLLAYIQVRWEPAQAARKEPSDHAEKQSSGAALRGLPRSLTGDPCPGDVDLGRVVGRPVVSG